MSFVKASRTVTDLKKYVQRMFGDESSVQVTDEDIVRWANLGQQEIFRQNEPLKSTGTADLVAGQSTYAFPDNILQVQGIRINGMPLQFVSFQEAQDRIVVNDPTNSQTGTPQFWYEYGGNFFLYPVPSAGQVAGIQIFYIPTPVLLTAITDNLTVPDTYFGRLCEFVMSQAYEMDENFEAASVKVQQFAAGMNQLSLDQSVEPNVYPTITILDDDL